MRLVKVGLGLVLTALGLWFAFWQGRLPDGHFDHVALYIGVGVALFGMLMVSPETVAEAVRDAKTLIGRRLSGSVPRQDDSPPKGD